MPLAGEGAPEVSEFAVTDYAATLGGLDTPPRKLGGYSTTGTDSGGRVAPARDEPARVETTTRTPRQVVLHVHLTDAAIRGASGEAVGRCGNTRSPISAAQIRQRCGDHDTEGYKIIRDHTGTHPVEDP